MKSLVQKIYPETALNYRLISLSNDLLKGKEVSNTRFDKMYPSIIRKLSSVYWTTVEVVQKAASLLIFQEGDKILDVGSGCGKFCIIGAASYPMAHFYGIEQRSHLNEIANRSAKNLNLSNVTFLEGNMMTLDWSEFDSFYLFNPFFENKMQAHRRIDLSVPATQDRYDFYIETVHAKLARLKKGTRVVTYHGFGGDFPQNYELQHKEKAGTSELELWIKKS